MIPGLLLLAGCSVLDDFPDPLVDCAALTDGAFVSLEVGEESFTAWSTNDAFIDAAIDHVQNGTTQVPVFAEVVAGTLCADAAWSWHVDPEAMEWADVTIELCDATPGYIEENRDAWIEDVGQWCPWSAAPIAVVDRR